jgi:hypothetical protein
MKREKSHAKTQRRKGSDHARVGPWTYRRLWGEWETLMLTSRCGRWRSLTTFNLLVRFKDEVSDLLTSPKDAWTSTHRLSHGPNLCAFASLREIFLRSLAICLESVNMVLRTFRYGFYKPAYAVKSG